MNFKRAVKILEMEPPVSPATLKTAFRRLALNYHPDRNPGDLKAEKKFRECLDAYNFLIEHMAHFSDITEIDDALSGADKITNLDNIFDDIFGFSTEGRVLGFHAPQPLELLLSEFALGVSKKISLQVYELCSSCEGKGSIHQAIDRICSYCFGRGSITAQDEKIPYPKICTRCHGRGRVIENPCLACNGFGKKASYKKVTLPILQGFWPEHSYTLNVQDAKGKHYETFVTFHLPVRTFFQVEKDKLICHYPVTAEEIQHEIEFPTPWGWHKFKPTGLTHVLSQAGLLLSPGKREKSDLFIVLRDLPQREAVKLKREFIHEVTFKNPHYGYVESTPWYKKLF